MASGSDTQTSTSSTASANPNVTKTVDQLLGGVQDAYKAGPAVFDKSLYGGVGDTTKNAWASTLGAAGNTGYSDAINKAIGSFGKVASGDAFGTNDPGYATLRANAANDAATTVNGIFNNSGRFGGGTHVERLGEGITNATAGLDYANYQNDIARQQQATQILPQLFQSSLLPSTAAGAVGSAQDANTQATLLGNNDLFRRQNDGKTDLLAKLSGILAGNSAASGTTTTNTTPSTPWYQSLLGGALGLGAAFL